MCVYYTVFCKTLQDNCHMLHHVAKFSPVSQPCELLHKGHPKDAPGNFRPVAPKVHTWTVESTASQKFEIVLDGPSLGRSKLCFAQSTEGFSVCRFVENYVELPQTGRTEAEAMTQWQRRVFLNPESKNAYGKCSGNPVQVATANHRKKELAEQKLPYRPEIGPAFPSVFKISLCFCLLKTWRLPHVYNHSVVTWHRNAPGI